jgi:serine/threonine-protein kinase RsbW/stage II sporulation protein AB (anti-sigma F factor)
MRLVLPARSENVSLVRHALAGLAEAAGMDDAGIADVRAVATEACVNVAVHAYDEGEAGALEVVASIADGSFEIIVRDFGHGFRPRVAPAGAEQSLRLGLPLIATLASSFELRGNPGGGTELRMALALPIEEEPGTPGPPPARVAEPREDTVVSIGDADLAGLVVSRVLSSLGVRADLSVDKLSDAILLGDAIAGGAPDGFVDGRVQVAVSDQPGAIAVKVGPLREGAAERLLAALEVPTLGASLRMLADDIRVETAAGGDHLMFKVAERGARSG